MVIAPAFWTVGAEAVSYRTQMAGGVILIAVTMWTLGIPWLKGAEWIKVVLGCWLHHWCSATGAWRLGTPGAREP